MTSTRHRITVFYAMKGGSGTTVTAALAAITNPDHTLIVDLGGDMADALGRQAPPPTLDDWLLDVSFADTPLDDLIIEIDASTRLLPASRRIDLSAGSARQRQSFHDWLSHHHASVVVDAGTGIPHVNLVEQADQILAVTRPCYLALTKAARTGFRPDGVVVVRERGRALGDSDIERAFNASILGTIDEDPAIARLADAGLLSVRGDRIGVQLHQLLDHPRPPSALDVWRAADPARQSPDVGYGMSWSSRREPERRWRVSWNTGSGDLYAVDGDDEKVIDLGHHVTSDGAARAIESWSELHIQDDGFDQLLQRLGRRGRYAEGPSIA